jgi:tetratricopeptide (TPR) repeat protein
MKDEDFSNIVRSLDLEMLERMEERDRTELELEKSLEKLTMERNDKKGKAGRKEEARGISRKYYEIANGLVEDAKYAEAIDLYSKAIQIMRKYTRRIDGDSYFNRAITFAMLGYPEMAMKDLHVVENLKPKKADVYFVKGQIYESTGKRKIALRMYRKSLEIDPNFWRAKNSIENMTDE